MNLNEIMGMIAKHGYDDVSKIISSVQQEYKERIIRSIENERLDRGGDEWDDGFNSALDTIIDIITKT